MRRLALVLFFALNFSGLISSQAARAELRLPAVIADNMVLQHGQAVPIWGWANPGETVQVAIADKAAKSTAGPDVAYPRSLYHPQ